MEHRDTPPDTFMPVLHPTLAEVSYAHRRARRLNTWLNGAASGLEEMVVTEKNPFDMFGGFVSELLGLPGSCWTDSPLSFRRMVVSARNTSQSYKEQKHRLNRLVSTFRPEGHPLSLERLLLPGRNFPLPHHCS